MEPAWLVVGLGNPGRAYEHTRHNAGARAVGLLAARLDAKLGRSRFKALVAEARLGDVPVKICRPTTYMNESGQAVGPVARWYKVPPERLIVVHDELDLALGRLRVKKGGGTAGHHGLDSIVEALGTKDFHRVRIGVGKPRNADQTINWVLERLPREAAESLAETEAAAAEAALSLIEEGLQPTMTRFNAWAAGRPAPD
jgi:PTH1 family peptidyl-tRNA hydrolase